VITEEEKKDKNIFKQIIEENWEDFKKKYPSYNKPYYEEVIKKTLLCGSEQGDIRSIDVWNADRG